MKIVNDEYGGTRIFPFVAEDATPQEMAWQYSIDVFADGRIRALNGMDTPAQARQLIEALQAVIVMAEARAMEVG